MLGKLKHFKKVSCSFESIHVLELEQKSILISSLESELASLSALQPQSTKKKETSTIYYDVASQTIPIDFIDNALPNTTLDKTIQLINSACQTDEIIDKVLSQDSWETLQKANVMHYSNIYNLYYYSKIWKEYLEFMFMS